MEYGSTLWHNGKFIQGDDTKISIIYHSLHYGVSAFEGIRFYETPKGPAIFRSDDHYNRLKYSCSRIEFSLEYSTSELTEATKELIKKHKYQSGYIRPIACFGEQKMGLNPQGAEQDVYIAIWPWGKYLSSDPITVGISPWKRIHPETLPQDAKISGHYVNSVISSQWAKKENYQEALLLDCSGNVAEGPGENIFIIKDGQLKTPALGNVLKGITRDSIIRIAEKELGLETLETTLTPEDIWTADEAFFTGTAAEVTLIASLDGKAIGSQENTISSQLRSLYEDIVSGKKEEYHNWLTFI